MPTSAVSGKYYLDCSTEVPAAVDHLQPVVAAVHHDQRATLVHRHAHRPLELANLVNIISIYTGLSEI